MAHAKKSFYWIDSGILYGTQLDFIALYLFLLKSKTILIKKISK